MCNNPIPHICDMQADIHHINICHQIDVGPDFFKLLFVITHPNKYNNI